MTFWTFRSTTGDVAPLVLVHFTSILGIHRRALAYKSAYSYTPILSALIWIGRLLFLEYALPLHAYSTLAWPWPARDSYADQTERLEQIRVKYLLRDNPSRLETGQFDCSTSPICIRPLSARLKSVWLRLCLDSNL
ncbi:hypothetical protein BKA65DRAFT_435308 [Rhexocercosporidium sp. MPI-PUGE-AT-0058]|nr:hypothetical protein BKA65DRAFT_435308 [Rhexocercosporidium sp. MPI-PUGE-AT-0058]